jgi:hypothetical protein
MHNALYLIGVNEWRFRISYFRPSQRVRAVAAKKPRALISALQALHLVQILSAHSHLTSKRRV